MPWTLAVDLLLLLPWRSQLQPAAEAEARGGDVPGAGPVPSWQRPLHYLAACHNLLGSLGASAGCRPRGAAEEQLSEERSVKERRNITVQRQLQLSLGSGSDLFDEGAASTG